ncbi:hypothetical protein B0T25DRAFT_322219 [Lasiosphaeria hispida]|uniref:Uncharacterized protein n=1 Tax=Lasiosphaeria hispida TaxID=260671 RepID=A0AAJ0M9R1_9PEZI|nr:hypothetical protein B0T25DRAFT_322219 [Lasiosphaeria hispida]
MSTTHEDVSVETEVISLDPAHPLDPQPLVADILRTHYYIPRSVFLVESIDPCIAVGGRYRAVRLILGDGEMCIQALLRPEMHCFIDRGQVYEGCYVRVDKVELKVVEVEERRMAYLLVGDVVTVGWNNVYLAMLKREGRGAGPVGLAVAARTLHREGSLGSGLSSKAAAFQLARDAAKITSYQKPDTAKQEETTAPPAPGQELSPLLKKEDEEPDYISDSDDSAFETLEISAARVTERRVGAGDAVPRPEHQSSTTPQQSNARSKSLPWASNDLSKPVKLTNLYSIPRLPYKQNWMVNVLVVIASLSDLEPCAYPPYNQRTARLTDPSTSKQVLLTVFLEAEAFTPAVGSVALLAGVKNHVFDGGSLKKYVSDKPKNGTSWWVKDPETLGWCQAEVQMLREWWAAGGNGEEGRVVD